MLKKAMIDTLIPLYPSTSECFDSLTFSSSLMSHSEGQVRQFSFLHTLITAMECDENLHPCVDDSHSGINLDEENNVCSTDGSSTSSLGSSDSTKLPSIPPSPQRKQPLQAGE